jgi:DNA-binding transcriptional MerR regulator
MIRIGDFSKLSYVSIKTLRFYDEVGLFKPIEVDSFTGYRYYEFDQLPRLHRILALRDLGFSLEEIGQLLEEGLSTEQMRGMLKLRQSELKQQVQEEKERLERVENQLRQIEQEEEMSKYDVVIKKVEPMQVAGVRGTVPTPPEQGSLWSELECYLEMKHVRPVGSCFTLYYDEDHRERDWDVEVCEPIQDKLSETRRVSVRTLPGVESMASTIHHGPFTAISEAYVAIGKWIEANGYRITGPCRELYLRPPGKEGDQNDPETVSEIQFPVEKA